VDPLVCPGYRTSVARTNTSTVEDVLDGEINVRPHTFTLYLYPVPEGTHSTMGPTGAAVLGDVLIAAGGAVVDAILIAPIEFLRNVD